MTLVAESELQALAGASASAALEWVEEKFGAQAAVASSFGLEDMVLIHLCLTHAPRVNPVGWM